MALRELTRKRRSAAHRSLFCSYRKCGAEPGSLAPGRGVMLF